MRAKEVEGQDGLLNISVLEQALEESKLGLLNGGGIFSTNGGMDRIELGLGRLVDVFVDSKFKKLNWAVLSDEQMRKRLPFSLLNDEQMSNKVGVEHQPVKNGQDGD